MKIEKLEVSNKKFKLGMLLGFILAILVVILINYLTSRANYRNMQSIDLAKGTINYKAADFSMLAFNIQQVDDQGEAVVDNYKTQSTIPNGKYVFNETKTYCTVGSENTKHEGITALSLIGISITYENNNLTFSGIKDSPTKCYIFLDVAPTPEDMIAKLEAAKGSKYTIEELVAPFGKDGSESTNKLYKYPEGEDYTYVFRGNVTDNWLRFANKTWRIIRINSDGTLRVIFQCNTNDCTTTTGSGTHAITGIAYSQLRVGNTYVGYYYGEKNGTYEQVHSNKTPNTIAEEITQWYNDNLSSYSNKISGSTGFCNDRRISTADNIGNYTGNGTGEIATAYMPNERLYNKNNVTPDLSCVKNDLYTTIKEPGEGNGVLEVPVALITADEVALAGMLFEETNAVTSNWLYTGEYYWTMSPSHYYSSNSNLFYVRHAGYQSFAPTDTKFHVRPVINLKTNVTITGKGTTDNPFIAS